MIGRKGAILPILTPMTQGRRVSTTEPQRGQRRRKYALYGYWIVFSCCLLSMSIGVLESKHAWGQSREPRGSISIPEPDQQPASPWSKPFRVSVPATSPQRHVQTQNDSWDAPIARDRVPEGVEAVTTSSARRIQATLASRVSQDVLTPTLLPSSEAVPSVEPPVGWRATEAEIRSGLERCDHLLRRGAVHSARQDVLAALRQLTRALDSHRGRWESEPALQQALTALKEAEDFERTSLTESTSVQRVVRQHQTPILQERSLDAVSPSIAAQYYRMYARDALALTADNHPWAADLYYALGKTYERESQQDGARQLTLLQHATVCFQAAHAIAPNRHHIANQLGFNLLQLDRVDEAMIALEQSIAIRPTTNAYRNLAEAYRRQGDTEQMRQAAEHANLLATREPNYSAEKPEITEISPEEFARISPPPVAGDAPKATQEASTRSVFPRIMR